MDDKKPTARVVIGLKFLSYKDAKHYVIKNRLFDREKFTIKKAEEVDAEELIDRFLPKIEHFKIYDGDDFEVVIGKELNEFYCRNPIDFRERYNDIRPLFPPKDVASLRAHIFIDNH